MDEVIVCLNIQLKHHNAPCQLEFNPIKLAAIGMKSLFDKDALSCFHEIFNEVKNGGTKMAYLTDFFDITYLSSNFLNKSYTPKLFVITTFCDADFLNNEKINLSIKKWAI